MREESACAKALTCYEDSEGLVFLSTGGEVGEKSQKAKQRPANPEPRHTSILEMSFKILFDFHLTNYIVSVTKTF